MDEPSAIILPMTAPTSNAPSDGHEVFTEPWVAAWADEIRGSDAYRQAAATWEGSVALAMNVASADEGNSERGVFLDLWHGECREARVASDDDLKQADFVLAANLDVWRRVLARDLDPIMGLMTGKVKLRKGSLAKLTPQINASKELVLAATRVPSSFPED